MKKQSSVAMMAVIFALGASVSIAQDDAGLYSRAPDPNAGYIRVVTADRIGSYKEYDAGTQDLTLEGLAVAVELEPGMYITLTQDSVETIMTIEDTLTFSPAKADLTFYNLSDVDGVDIFVPRAQVNAIAGVGAGDVAFQTLRAPLTIDLEIRSGDQVLAFIPMLDLRRGEGASIVLTGAFGSYAAIAANNTYRGN